ncbi:UNVERIFIED_CONTAM: hypothetical protein Sindi_0855300, partial [Sesamum indicum]
MSMITQDLPSLPVVTQEIGRFGINEDYAGPSSDAGPSSYAADSLLNAEQADSEPDEVEVEDQIDHNNDDDGDVSITIMMDVLGEYVDGTTHPKVPADSIDIPTGKWGNFYDSNTGELANGMVFKSKDHLKASVQDYSIRFARGEYRVVESNKQLQKVACKYDEQTGCCWMLRAILKSNMGFFKVT